MKRVFLISLFCSFALPATAQEYRPRLSIASEVQVNSETVLLGDIASIEGRFEEFETLLNDLKGTTLGVKLRPLENITIPGTKILESIEAQGIPLDAFGYSIPVEIKIIRGGRSISKEEVLSAAKAQLQSDLTLEIAVKGVEWETDQVIPAGETTYHIETLGAPDRGKMPIRVTARQKDQASARFLATALVDDWKSIPVVRGRLDRGSVIGAADIQVIRTNLATLPIDIALSPEEITGKRVIKSLSSGEPVRLSDLDIPPVIERGKLVKMIYKSGGLTATASGISMEPGFSDNVIQVRNDRSNKIVKGKVLNAEEVLVLK